MAIFAMRNKHGPVLNMKFLRILIPALLLAALFAGAYTVASRSGSLVSGFAAPATDSTSVRALEQVLALRASGEIQMPLNADILLALLPDKLPDWQLKDARAAAFRSKEASLSEAKKVFSNTQDQLLTFSLIDCIGDSMGLRYAYRAFEAQRAAGQMSLPEPAALHTPTTGFFATIREMPDDRTRVLEAGFCYRFLIVITASQPAKTEWLQTAFDTLDWGRMVGYCGEGHTAQKIKLGTSLQCNNFVHTKEY